MCDLRKEYKSFREKNPSPYPYDAAKEVMHAPRFMCESAKKFTAWIPGLSPKEHIDMNMMDRAEQYHERLDRRNFWTNFVLVIVGALAAVAAWWGALHPTAIPPPQITIPAPQVQVMVPPAASPAAARQDHITEQSNPQPSQTNAPLQTNLSPKPTP
jgi:hypothetical protein